MKDEELFNAWKSEQYKDQSTEEKMEFVEHLHTFPKYFEKTFLAGLKVRNDQLSKAKEIIKQLMYASRDCIAWYCLCDKAKQFLKEIEK